jgi:hypothetical protein
MGGFMTTTVIARKDAPPGWKADQNYVYIGRPSRWGNPFRMKNNSNSERIRVIDAYRKWLKSQEILIHAIARGDLDDKILVCHCHPELCHGDILADLANYEPEE